MALEAINPVITVDLREVSFEKSQRKQQHAQTTHTLNKRRGASHEWGMGTFKSMPVRKEVSEISAGNWSPSGAQRRIDLEACKLLALTRQEEMGWAPVVG